MKKQPEAGGVSSGYKKVVSGLFEYGQNAVHMLFFSRITKGCRECFCCCATSLFRKLHLHSTAKMV